MYKKNFDVNFWLNSIKVVPSCTPFGNVITNSLRAVSPNQFYTASATPNFIQLDYDEHKYSIRGPWVYFN